MLRAWLRSDKYQKYCSTIPVFIKQVFCNAVNIFTTQVKQLIERRHQIQSYIETRIDEQRKTFDPQNIRNFLDLYLEQEGHTDAKMSGTPFSFTNPIEYVILMNLHEYMGLVNENGVPDIFASVCPSCSR
jgi:hypothetical protein